MGLLEGNIEKILNSALVGIILCDGEHNCIEVSDIALKILGLSTNQIIGKNIEEVLKTAGLGIVLNEIRKVSEGKETQCRIYTLKLTPSPHVVKIKMFPYSNRESPQSLFVILLCEIWPEEAPLDDSINREFIFKKLFYNAILPMWIYDPDTLRFLVVNDSAVKTYGYASAEFLSMRITDLNCMEENDFEYEKNGIIRGGSAIQKHRKKDGSIIYVETTESPIVFANKNATMVLARDVTEDLKARVELDYSNELLSLVWEHSPEGLRLTDENGVIIKVNESFCKLVGKKREELEGKNFTIIYDSSIAERIEKSFISRFKQRAFPDKFEDNFRLWDGREVWFEVRNSFFEMKGKVPMVLSIFRDITESKQIFEDLKRSEQRHKTLAEHVSDVVCVTDANMKVMDVSPSVSRFLGYAEQELTGKPLTLFLSPNSLNLFQHQLFENPVQKGLLSTSIVVELEFIRKDGFSTWAEVCVDALFSQNKDHVGYVWAIRDINERLRAQSTLRLQAAALESAASGIVITTIDGTIVWVNSAFTQLTGYDIEEAIGRKTNILNSGRQSHEFYQRLWETILSGRNWHGELVNKRKDGSLYIEEMTITPVFGLGQEITHFVAIKSDITKRKEMERELRHSQKRFELIFNSNPAGMVIATLRDFRFIEVNNSFLEITKFSREEVVGCCMDEMDIFPNPEEWEELKKKLSSADSVNNFEIIIRSKENKQHNVLVSTEKIILGLEECAIFIFNDITERKVLEEQLRRSNKLEMLGSLASGVVHDFNNILTVIQGHTSMALLNAGAPKEIQNSLKEIHDAAERAANLTRQILVFNRKQKIEPVSVSVNQVISNFIKSLKRLVGENIKLESNLYPDIPNVLADIGLIEQVLMNLVVNARDAMPKGGSITISTNLQYVPVYKLPSQKNLKDGDYVVISVRDTGVGIKPEHLQKIFEPFFTTKPVGKGTGLGLSIVQNAVHQLNGWIDVKSEVNVGTEFFVFLPSLEQINKPPVRAQEAQMVKGGAETLLIIEDDERVRELARAVLEQYGYKILAARDYEETLQLWNVHKNYASLIIVDMVLPGGVSGVRVAEQFCQQKPGLKVILMCGYSPASIQSQIYNLRGWQYIQKPFLPSYLARIVRQVLDTNSNLINQ